METGARQPSGVRDSGIRRAANRRVTIVVLTGQRTADPVVDHAVPWAEGPALEAQ